MNNVPAGSSGQQQQPPSDCSSCDLVEIEALTCTAKKFARQAEVMNEVTQPLEDWRTQFQDARKKYADAQDSAAVELATIRELLDGMRDQLRCRLTDDQRNCVKESAKKVFEEIRACGEPSGCQSPCQGGDDTADQELAKAGTDAALLAAEIERRRLNLTASAAYFTALIAEPDAITQQLTALTAAAKALVADVAAGGDSSKAVSWYARLLILDTSAVMSRLGRGFASVKAYVDCLCGVLKCLVSGWNIVAVLEGRKAEIDCHASATKVACEKKKADPLQAILDSYEECCKENQVETTDQGAPVPSTDKPAEAL